MNVRIIEFNEHRTRGPHASSDKGAPSSAFTPAFHAHLPSTSSPRRRTLSGVPERLQLIFSRSFGSLMLRRCDENVAAPIATVQIHAQRRPARRSRDAEIAA